MRPHQSVTYAAGLGFKSDGLERDSRHNASGYGSVRPTQHKTIRSKERGEGEGEAAGEAEGEAEGDPRDRTTMLLPISSVGMLPPHWPVWACCSPIGQCGHAATPLASVGMLPPHWPGRALPNILPAAPWVDTAPWVDPHRHPPHPPGRALQRPQCRNPPGSSSGFCTSRSPHGHRPPEGSGPLMVIWGEGSLSCTLAGSMRVGREQGLLHIPEGWLQVGLRGAVPDDQGARRPGATVLWPPLASPWPPRGLPPWPPLASPA